jgi:peptidoglycan/LPS O-acetylase OafA/YrhL
MITADSISIVLLSLPIFILLIKKYTFWNRFIRLFAIYIIMFALIALVYWFTQKSIFLGILFSSYMYFWMIFIPIILSIIVLRFIIKKIFIKT